LIIQKFYTEFF